MMTRRYYAQPYMYIKKLSNHFLQVVNMEIMPLYASLPSVEHRKTRQYVVRLAAKIRQLIQWELPQ